MMSNPNPPYRCLFCGAPSWREPSEQVPPPDYCHEEDHGTPEEYLDGARRNKYDWKKLSKELSK